MSKSRSSSLGSAGSYANETSDSSFRSSDLSFGTTSSEQADNIEIILGSFIPEEFIPSHGDIEEGIDSLVSTRSSRVSGDMEEGIAQVSEGIADLIAEETKKDIGLNPSLSSTKSLSSSKHNVGFFRSVVDKLNLGRFLYGIKDEAIKEQYEILFESTEEHGQPPLRPELTGMNKGELKKFQKKVGSEHKEGRIVRPKLAKKTLAEVRKEEAKVRSDLKAISSYERNCMGGVNFDVAENGNLIVSADSAIDRPTNITGNLGQVAGDHVVPLAMLTRRLQSIVQGQEVYEAIRRVKDFAAGITDIEVSGSEERYRDQNSFQEVIEQAGSYEPNAEQPRMAGYTSNADLEAFNFLKSKLIPTTVRTWNMQTRAAFHGKKTKKELGKEGNKVKNILKDLLITGGEGSSFISVIDYSPVAMDADRGNDVQQLALIIGSIIDANHLINDQDIPQEGPASERQNTASAENIFNKMLKEHGWIKHYKDNPQDLDPALSIEDGSPLGDEHIKKVIMNKMLEQYPHLKDELDYKTQVKKEELEKDNYIVQDVSGDGNCFFHAVAL